MVMARSTTATLQSLHPGLTRVEVQAPASAWAKAPPGSFFFVCFPEVGGSEG
jgi:hypothetical protein